MRHNPAFAVNPWATIVSDREGEIVASHYPILTHVGRPDDQIHGLGEEADGGGGAP
jgi:hypothetical protein